MKNLSITSVSISIILLLFFWGCVKKPHHIKAVINFDVNQYVGKWYEIARLDHSFEKSLSHVYAEYSLNSNGSIKVVNSGIKAKSGKRRYANGVAKFMASKEVGYLKVSFFRPFYGAYILCELDPDYQYAYVTSNDQKYLWLLARTPSVSENVKQDFVKKVKDLGFATEQLIWVNQSSEDMNPAS